MKKLFLKITAIITLIIASLSIAGCDKIEDYHEMFFETNDVNIEAIQCGGIISEAVIKDYSCVYSNALEIYIQFTVEITINDSNYIGKSLTFISLNKDGEVLNSQTCIFNDFKYTEVASCVYLYGFSNAPTVEEMEEEIVTEIILYSDRSIVGSASF